MPVSKREKKKREKKSCGLAVQQGNQRCTQPISAVEGQRTRLGREKEKERDETARKPSECERSHTPKTDTRAVSDRSQ
jgi:hypothetical protein